MFRVLYRWKIKTEKEQQFVESWSEITLHLREKHNSLGSQLFRGNDGFYYGLAHWKSATDREIAFKECNENFEAREKMREAIEESFSEVVFDSVADFWI
ncbi:MAG: hypothetical protein MUC29_08505 [Pyrinomonadaceae bacterium]|jgi:hypothetical protein|nr:hypothetical protein [Pyrinomonadaceae bacterium]